MNSWGYILVRTAEIVLVSHRVKLVALILYHILLFADALKVSKPSSNFFLHNLPTLSDINATKSILMTSYMILFQINLTLCMWYNVDVSFCHKGIRHQLYQSEWPSCINWPGLFGE